MLMNEMAIPIAHVLTYFLGLTRILAMIVHIPMIAGRLVPNLVKVGVGILLAITILPPATLEHVEMMNTFLELTIAIGREILIGSLVGFGATLTFGAVQITGEIIGLGSGFSAAHILNPIFGTSDTITNQFFGMVSGLLFLVINGHLLFLMAVRQTFDILPLNQPLPSLSLDRLIALAGDLITTGVHLALPVLAALLLTDITLGLLARLAPQIQVFFLGLPLKLSVTLISLALTLGFLFPALGDIFRTLGPRSLGLLGY